MTRKRIRGYRRSLFQLTLIGLLFSGATGFLDVKGVESPLGITRVVPGHGVFVAGDFWCDIVPMNKEVWYRQVAPNYDPGVSGPTSASQNQTLVRLGNITRNWEEPVPQWPSGFPQGNYWNSNFEGAVYDPDPLFNPSTKKSYWSVSGPRYAYMFYTNQLPGAGDPSRNYARDAKYIDATRRDQVIYECGFPTNVGIDIKLTARQFTLNWNNLNDFILYEYTFTNTGVVDIDGDGTPEQINHKIAAFSFGTTREVAMGSGGAELSGTRGTDFTAPRLGGYVGDNDPDGNPWNMTVSFPGANPAVNPTKADFGMNNYSAKTFLDRWMGMSFLAVKQGNGNPANPDKKTVFGTHPIGAGTNRGWFNASGQGNNLIVGTRFDAFYNSGVHIGGPQISFIGYSGPFFQDGGKNLNSATIRAPQPNAKFFASGLSDTLSTWVVKPAIAAKLTAGTPLVESERPDGDQKLNSLDPAIGAAAFRQKWEDGTADVGVPYPTGWGAWTKGFSWDSGFDCGLFTGVGPFSLDVGESITVVFVEYAGYRLEGVQRSVRSARWAYETKWAAPATAFNLGFTIPKAPDMRVDITPTGTATVRWDVRAETDADFAGYKIWRSTNAPPNFEWIKSGMRIVDRYQEQMVVGPTDPQFKKPVNPKFVGQADINAISTKGIAQGREWGPYQLVAVVPKANLAGSVNVSGAFNYLYEDKSVIYGFDYWYYVAAYKEAGTYAMFPGETNPRIESSNLNRNGRSGLWLGTYSYADNNSLFPASDAGKKDIGARFTVRSRTVSTTDLNLGTLTPKAIPNPYKRAAAFDNIQSSTDHKIKFFNLPARGRLTILDVAGQIVDQIDFDNQTGVSDVTWTMFSKDGVEVANGMYIYVVEAGNGVGIPSGGYKFVGKFAILR
jgi:hypothetical protein